jgi:hypothetical protein
VVYVGNFKGMRTCPASADVGQRARVLCHGLKTYHGRTVLVRRQGCGCSGLHATNTGRESWALGLI